MFQVSTATLWRAQVEGSQFLEKMKAYPITTRKKIDQSRINEAIDFINDHAPVVSGKNYRLLTTSDDFLYQKYHESCKRPIGKTFFVYKILSSFNCHRSTVPNTCPYCVGIAPQSRKGSGEALRLHKKQAKIQEHEYLHHKDRVSHEKKFILIVQDFSQIMLVNKSFQDLIVTVYYNDRGHPHHIAHDFRHFISCANNDITFVSAVWEQFFNELLTQYKPKEIAIWSDGSTHKWVILA